MENTKPEAVTVHNIRDTDHWGAYYLFHFCNILEHTAQNIK